MAIVDLKSRLSSDRDLCEASKMSSESFIYTDTEVNVIEGNPMSIDLHVGDICIFPGDSRTYKIDKRGVKVKPRQSVVLYSKEKFVIPLNVFGIVTGKGTYIFQGCIVASGKIDPGYRGNLKVCFFNGGRSTVTIKPNDVFCTVFFMDGDCTLSSPLADYQENPNPILSTIRWWQKIWLNIVSNKFTVFLVCINLITAIHWIYTDFIKENNKNDDSSFRKSERVDRTNIISATDSIR